MDIGVRFGSKDDYQFGFVGNLSSALLYNISSLILTSVFTMRGLGGLCD